MAMFEVTITFEYHGQPNDDTSIQDKEDILQNRWALMSFLEHTNYTAKVVQITTDAQDEKFEKDYKKWSEWYKKLGDI